MLFNLLLMALFVYDWKAEVYTYTNWNQFILFEINEKTMSLNTFCGTCHLLGYLVIKSIFPKCLK